MGDMDDEGIGGLHQLATYRNACDGIVGYWKSLMGSRAVCIWHAKHVSELHPWVCSGVVVNVECMCRKDFSNSASWRLVCCGG